MCSPTHADEFNAVSFLQQVTIGTKIIDKIHAHRKTLEEDGKTKPFHSFEFFPPRTEKGIKNLEARMVRMRTQEPLFVDFTWGAGGTTAELTAKLSTFAQQKLGYEVNMHITCTNMDKQKLVSGLKSAYDAGIKNICALRGDPPAGQDIWEAADQSFTCGRDLVEFIKKEYGDYFGIHVAGYPEGHPDKIKPVGSRKLTETEKSRVATIFEEEDMAHVEAIPHVCSDEDYEADLLYLKSKVEAGADIIISQLFYDPDVFLQWVADCRRVGIKCPILPGIMPLTKYNSFRKMIKMCKTRVPEEVFKRAVELKDNQEELRKFGIDLGVQYCRKLLQNGLEGLHFYTMNLELATYGIMSGLGLM